MLPDVVQAPFFSEVTPGENDSAKTGTSLKKKKMGKASNPWVNLLIKRGTVTTKPVQASLRGSGKKGAVQQLNSQLRKSIVFLMTFLLTNSELVATNR